MFDGKLVIQRLKAYRDKNAVTQGELADLIGTSGPTLSRWLNGRTGFNPTLKQLMAMADMFGLTLIELLSMEKTSAPVPTEKAPKRKGKTTKEKPAAKTSAKAVSAKSSKAKSESPSSARKGKTSAAAVSKDEKTKKNTSAKKPARKSLKPIAAPDTEASKKKRGRPKKASRG